MLREDRPLLVDVLGRRRRLAFPEPELSLRLPEVGQGRADEDEEKRSVRRDEADPLLPPREVGRDRAGDVDREEPLEPQEPPRVVDEPSRGRRIRAGLEDRPGREAEEEGSVHGRGLRARAAAKQMKLARVYMK